MIEFPKPQAPGARDEGCSVCEALGRMSEGDATRTRDALSSKLGAQPIADTLRANGHYTSRWVVTKHRNERHPA